MEVRVHIHLLERDLLVEARVHPMEMEVHRIQVTHTVQVQDHHILPERLHIVQVQDLHILPEHLHTVQVQDRHILPECLPMGVVQDHRTEMEDHPHTNRANVSVILSTI